MGKRSEKITVRLTPYQAQVLTEMCGALDTTNSMLIRTIVGDWLSHNEEYVYRIIDRKKNNYASDK